MAMIRRLLGVVALVVAAMAVTPVGAQAATPAVRIVADPHNGQHIALHRGDRLQVTLSACETCGYSWNVTKRPRAAVASYVSRASTGTAVCYPGPCVGGNAEEAFDFVANGYGQTLLRLGYTGPGTTGVVRRLTLSITVVRHGRSSAAGLHLVRSGDTLYRIARAELHTSHNTARVAALASRIYTDNHETIGSRPDFVLPGELLLVDPTGL
jgi:predicted secreted protein